MRARYVVLLTGGVVILAAWAFALRMAHETAVWACIVSVHQGVHNLNLSEKDFPDASSEWTVLSESDSSRIILAASKIHPFDCSRVAPRGPHFDDWGRPLQIGVRKSPGGGPEFRVWSKGRDGESGTSDDLVSPWGERAISSE
jgi:hypothetical protein